jgi:hypothetical protein
MIIGNFSYDPAHDTHVGEITTLTLQRSQVVMRPTGKLGDRDFTPRTAVYRAQAGRVPS